MKMLESAFDQYLKPDLRPILWQDHVLTALNKERWECRDSSITVREYNPEDVQSLVDIYYNTIHLCSFWFS